LSHQAFPQNVPAILRPSSTIGDAALPAFLANFASSRAALARRWATDT
jgi:hypothetical protein